MVNYMRMFSYRLLMLTILLTSYNLNHTVMSSALLIKIAVPLPHTVYQVLHTCIYTIQIG